MNHLPFLYRCNISYQQKKVPFPLLLLMEEILHHLGCIKLMKTPVNNGITYQPQLVSRMSAINRMWVYWEGQPPLVFLASFKSSGNRPSQLDDTSLLSITSCLHPFRYQVVIPAEYSPTHVTHHHHVETKNIYMTKKIHANQSINQSIQTQLLHPTFWSKLPGLQDIVERSFALELQFGGNLIARSHHGCLVDWRCMKFKKDVIRELTYPIKREVRKIINSKVSAGMGYVSSWQRYLASPFLFYYV